MGFDGTNNLIEDDEMHDTLYHVHQPDSPQEGVVRGGVDIEFNESLREDALVAVLSDDFG